MLLKNRNGIKMDDYGLIKSFDIDHNELDQLSRQQCFVLGYELAQIDTLLEKPEGFSRPLNADNRERVEKACRAAGRRFLLNWMPLDQSESWMQLDVAQADAA